MEFADKLEKATLETIESGKMTKDLALITSLENVTVLNSKEFILAIREKLDEITGYFFDEMSMTDPDGQEITYRNQIPDYFITEE